MTRITRGGEQFHFASYSETDEQWIVSNQRFVLTEDENIAAVRGIFLRDLWYNVSGGLKERKYLIIQSRALKIPVQELVSQLGKTLNNYKNKSEMEKITGYVLTQEPVVERCAYFVLKEDIQSRFMGRVKNMESERIVAECVTQDIIIKLDFHATKLPSAHSGNVENSEHHEDQNETIGDICLSNPEFTFMF